VPGKMCLVNDCTRCAGSFRLRAPQKNPTCRCSGTKSGELSTPDWCSTPPASQGYVRTQNRVWKQHGLQTHRGGDMHICTRQRPMNYGRKKNSSGLTLKQKNQVGSHSIAKEHSSTRTHHDKPEEALLRTFGVEALPTSAQYFSTHRFLVACETLCLLSSEVWMEGLHRC